MFSKKDFYVSYVKYDEDWARWICCILESYGYTTVMKVWDFRPGTNLISNMHRALSACDRVVAVLSPAYFESVYCEAEWTAALNKDPNFEIASLIPVRIQDFEPVGIFAQIVCIDIFGVESEEAKKRLINGVDILSRPSNRPGTPGTLRKLKFPEQLPFNNFPFRQNYNFIGRNKYLLSIKKFLNESTDSIVFLVGLGGVGKTQIALKYAYLNSGEYGVIWWINATNTYSIIEAYRKFLLQKNLITKHVNDIGLIKESIWNWMNENKNWLFIYDNAESAESLYYFLPKNNIGHIIVTSQHSDWYRYGKTICVDPFTEKEGVLFLEKITNNNDREGASLLSRKIDHFPLALDHAAAYVNSNKIAYAEYAILFEKYSFELLSNEHYSSIDHFLTVEITWKIIVDKINKESSNQLLNICALFASENIDKKIFSSLKKYLPEPLKEEISDEIKFNELLSELVQYSLIKVQYGKISIHSLLQKVVQRANNNVEWVSCCVDYFDECFIFDINSIKTWSWFEQLVPHAISVANRANEVGLHRDSVSKMYREAGSWFSNSAMYQDAEMAFSDALKIDKELHGNNSQSVVADSLGLGLVYYRTGKLEDALALFQVVKDYREKTLGRNHIDTASIYNNIGIIQYVKKNYMEASEWYEKSLLFYNMFLVNAARTFNNAALVYNESGGADKAMEYYLKSLRLYQIAQNEGHPDYGSTYGNIADIYYKKRDYKNAIKWNKKGLQVKKKIFGEEHPDVAKLYCNIGDAYGKIGDYKKALNMIKKAWKIVSKKNWDNAVRDVIYSMLLDAYASAGGNMILFEEWAKSKANEI